MCSPYFFPVRTSQADLLQTFHQSLAVVEPTPGDRNVVTEHGPGRVAVTGLAIHQKYVPAFSNLVFPAPPSRRACRQRLEGYKPILSQNDYFQMYSGVILLFAYTRAD